MRADLLERTVKRDRKVDALQKKVKALAETLEVEQKVINVFTYTFTSADFVHCRTVLSTFLLVFVPS